MTRPTGAAYFRTARTFARPLAALFGMLADVLDQASPFPPRVRPLSEAAAAHEALEARGTTGSTILVP